MRGVPGGSHLELAVGIRDHQVCRRAWRWRQGLGVAEKSYLVRIGATVPRRRSRSRPAVPVVGNSPARLSNGVLAIVCGPPDLDRPAAAAHRVEHHPVGCVLAQVDAGACREYIAAADQRCRTVQRLTGAARRTIGIVADFDAVGSGLDCPGAQGYPKRDVAQLVAGCV